MHVANFTKDPIKWMHVGVTGTLEPDDITEFDDARGKHILNKWGARGLLRVTWDDRENEEEKRKEAEEIYRNFWMKQISYFNQHNESLKNENKPYVYPSKEVEAKAEEFGVPLIGPWKLKPPVSEESKKEMDTLKNQVEELTKMVSQVMGSLGDVTKQRDEALIAQFQGLDELDFRTWIKLNESKVLSWPASVQALVQAKWVGFYGEEAYPIPV